MKKELSKKDAQDKIKNFFEKEKFQAEQAKSIKRLAMKYGIRLGVYKKRFCKKCFSDLINGKVRIGGNYKAIECTNCGYKNRWKISL